MITVVNVGLFHHHVIVLWASCFIDLGGWPHTQMIYLFTNSHPAKQ